MDKRTTGWGLTRNQAALLGAIIGYAILVVVVTPLLLGFLPLLAVGWMLRVPVASHPADRATLEIDPDEPLGGQDNRAGRVGRDHAGLQSIVCRRLTTLAALLTPGARPMNTRPPRVFVRRARGVYDGALRGHRGVRGRRSHHGVRHEHLS
jgi:hypothetical protein